ncbi:DUF6291 domain-containing protein [Treponema peruense]|uniref:DUF6291 domain-containing protein n=1 Tax=Treponema peruense TaxID=2787628 RepID=A0A7T3V5C0_9SPIR|nr:DUF6291 domain-containing protein [Treponema peruense]QQA00053.1 hypothetical protein IWA51_07130 [Treponema peruense]QQA01348.1 hypothetical protein IWA51_01640 [Treponema peruense]
MNKFKSFVFSETTKKQIDLMPTPEMKLKFYEAVTNYGMFGIEPENLNEIEMIIWLPMKDLIDNSKSSKGGAPSGNQNAQRKNLNNEENNEATDFSKNNSNYEKQPKQLEKVENNLKTTETTCFEEKQPKQPENNQTTLNNHNLNHNDNLNGNGNERENHNLNASEVVFGSLSPSQTEYSKKIFEIFKKARLPCARENEISFLQTDFKNALSVIHRKEELQNVHSDDIIQACRNFTDIYSNPGTYCGFRQKIGFYQLVQKQWFYDLLPANFDKNRFGVRTNNQEETRKTPEQIETQLLDEMKDDPRFIPKIFEHYHNEWVERGMPTGASYFGFQYEKCLSGYGQKLKSDFENEMRGSYGGQKSN